MIQYCTLFKSKCDNWLSGVCVSVCIGMSQCQMVNTQLQSWTLLFCCCQTTSSRPCFRFWIHFWRSAWEDRLPSVRHTHKYTKQIHFQEEVVTRSRLCDIMSSELSCVNAMMCDHSLTVNFLLLHISEGLFFPLSVCMCV